MSRWGPYVRQRIDDLKSGNGREDWEGQWPGPAVAEAAWMVAVGTFRDGTPTPSVVPTEDGWVAFVWHKNGHDAELEVGPEEASLWIYDKASGETWDGNVADHRGCCVQRLLDALEGDPATAR